MEGMLKSLLGIDPSTLQQNIEGMLLGIRDAILSTHAKIDQVNDRLTAIEMRLHAREIGDVVPAAETNYPVITNGHDHAG